MIVQEVKRLFSNRSFRIMILCLILINVFNLALGILSETTQVYEKEYQRYRNHESNTVEFAFDTTHSGGNIFYKQVTYVSGYHETLNAQLEELDKKLILGIFEQGLVQKQLNQKIQQLRIINQIDPQIIPSYSFGVGLKSSVPILSTLVLSVGLLYYLFFQDIQVKGLGLMRSSFVSLKGVYWIKLSILLISIIGFLLSISSGFLILSFLLGIPSSSPMQMIVGFEYYPYRQSVLAYIVNQSITRCMVVISISMVFLTLMLWIKNIIASIMIVFSSILCGLIMNLFIPANSLFVFFKYANYYALIFHEHYDLIYQNLFGSLFSIQSIITYSMIIIIGLCVVISHNIYNRSIDGSRSLFKFRLSNSSVHLLLQQAFQSMIVHKGYLIVIAVLVFSTYQLNTFNIVLSVEEKNVDQIAHKYYGTINQQSLDQVTDELRISENALTEYQGLLTQENLTEQDIERISELYPVSNRFSALTEIHQAMQQILENGGDEYVNAKGYKLWFSENTPFILIQNFLLITISVLIFTTVLVRFDFSTSLNHLFQSTQNGKRKLIHVNFGVALIFSKLIMCIVYGFHTVKIMKIYPLFDYNYTINSLIMTHSSVSLGLFIALQLLMFMLFLVTLIMITYTLATTYDAMIVIIGISILLAGCGVVYAINPVYSPLFILSSQFMDHFMLTVAYTSILLIILTICIYRIKRIYNITR